MAWNGLSVEGLRRPLAPAASEAALDLQVSCPKSHLHHACASLLAACQWAWLPHRRHCPPAREETWHCPPTPPQSTSRGPGYQEVKQLASMSWGHVPQDTISQVGWVPSKERRRGPSGSSKDPEAAVTIKSHILFSMSQQDNRTCLSMEHLSRNY